MQCLSSHHCQDVTVSHFLETCLQSDDAGTGIRHSEPGSRGHTRATFALVRHHRMAAQTDQGCHNTGTEIMRDSDEQSTSGSFSRFCVSMHSRRGASCTCAACTASGHRRPGAPVLHHNIYHCWQSPLAVGARGSNAIGPHGLHILQLHAISTTAFPSHSLM